jgi:20S proteasome alpha/beta subunit
MCAAAGTTIVGCIYAGDPSNPDDKGGIVLGADTRATEGSIVADKNCEKVRDCLTVLLLIYLVS